MLARIGECLVIFGQILLSVRLQTRLHSGFAPVSIYHSHSDLARCWCLVRLYSAAENQDQTVMDRSALNNTKVQQRVRPLS